MRIHLASLVENFRRHSAEIAVVAHRGNRRYRTSYGELAQLAGRFAAELERRQVHPGERVVLWGENSAEWIAAFFGCLLRGVIAVPLAAAGSAEFAERVVKDVAPRLIVGDARLLRSLPPSAPQLPFTEMAALLPTDPLFAVSEAVAEQMPFQIVFTSGTTSEPRGIVHTHRNVLASLQPIEDEIAKYRKYERWVHPLRFLHQVPLSHVFGQFVGLWTPALLAAELHFAEQPEPSRTVELLRCERISVLIAVPRLLQLLRAHLLARFPTLELELEQARGISAWKRWWRFRRVHRALGWKFWAVICGGATLPQELEKFWNRLGLALIQGYGMTETAALVTLNHPFRIGRGTIGKPLPGREVRLSDEGEIQVRGAMLAAATWQGGAMHPRQGEWLATGDLAARNEAGELRFLGRKGDVIVTAAGMNVYPADLETALLQQPGVRGCAVVPCTTAAGVEPIAVVLSSASDEELQQALREANRGLADYQAMRRVLRWPGLQLPYTSTGKLLRRQVEQWACAALAERQSTVLPSQNEDALLVAIAEITGEPASGREDGLRLSEDLRLDSLGRVQLQSALERDLGVELETDAIAGIETLGELRALLGQENSAVETQPAEGAARPSAVAPPSEDGHIYPRWPWIWPVRALRVFFLEVLLRPLVWLLAAPRVVPPPDEPPQGPLLIIANHVAAYDSALVLYALPRRLRMHTAIAMSGEMLLDFRHGRNQRSALRNRTAPAAWWLVTALFHVFPLPRSRGFRKSFAYAGEAMDRGDSVLIFPEGMRSRDGALQPFRPGIGLLALQSRVPVVPVALIGLGARLAGGVGWFRSGKLEVRVGSAIPVDEGATPQQLTARFEQEIRSLIDGRT